jgi:hypothetical protein
MPDTPPAVRASFGRMPRQPFAPRLIEGGIAIDLAFAQTRKQLHDESGPNERIGNLTAPRCPG